MKLICIGGTSDAAVVNDAIRLCLTLSRSGYGRLQDSTWSALDGVYQTLNDD